MKAEATGADFSAANLERRLGYRFSGAGLLDQALTHASASSTRLRTRASNERLEFLGDRVLGLAIAHLLFERFPREREGLLARRHAALVSREALTQVARHLRLSDALVLSKGEREGGGAHSPGILANTCEAIIGAIFVDGGWAPAFRVIERHWIDLIESAPTPPKDAKTELQEWAQGRGIGLPVYREVERSGPPHAPRFAIEVSITGAAPVVASGPSKRLAERAAAEKMLATLERYG